MLASCQHTQTTNESVVLEPNVTDTLSSDTIEAKYLTLQVNYHIWHRTSNSISNELVNSETRTDIIFNQARIKSQKFTPITGVKGISYNKVIRYPFIMEITFENDSIGVWGVYTNSKVSFTHIPNKANNLLKDDHPAKVVTFKGNATQKQTINAWRNQAFSLRCRDVFYNNKFILTECYHPMDKLSNAADYKHKD